jgi:hypothetical protein
MIAFEGICAKDCGFENCEHQIPKIEPPPRGLVQLVWNSLANDIFICVQLLAYQSCGMFQSFIALGEFVKNWWLGDSNTRNTTWK